ncbi:MAG: hypothetical protein JRJ87_17775 [Deltaproteobacteria bacterium]|nr:hypothetical protein [Deltaproteobacteria bacterium]
MPRILPTIVVIFAFSYAFADDDPKESKPDMFKVEQHLFAHAAHFDGKGQCQAVGKVALKSWWVRGFPAEIPHFETCTTISSKTRKGEIDIDLAVVSKDGDRLLRVGGVLDLGIDGRASQAIDWDHLVVPAAGTYFMQIKIEGNEVARFAMQFKKRKAKKRK